MGYAELSDRLCEYLVSNRRGMLADCCSIIDGLITQDDVAIIETFEIFQFRAFGQ